MGNLVVLRNGNKAVAYSGSVIRGHRFRNREFSFSEKKLGKAQRALSKEKKAAKKRARCGKICA